jgi:heme/copper-type cytochrome/quinol oxidase subunit 3
VLDSAAPAGEGFSHHAPIWWGNRLVMLIEAAGFAVLVLTYFYIWRSSDNWPPTGVRVPDIGIGMLNLAILVVSIFPMWHAARLALRNDRPRALGYWLLLCVLFGLAATILRLMEFRGVHARWNSNPYGAIVWSILAVHFAHILAATLETLTLGILMLRGPVEEKHYGDISVNALYWYFVALSWVGLWTVLYLAPRVI